MVRGCMTGSYRDARVASAPPRRSSVSSHRDRCDRTPYPGQASGMGASDLQQISMDPRYSARVADDPAHPPAERTDHSPWNLLLLVAVVVPLLTFLYDSAEPRLF